MADKELGGEAFGIMELPPPEDGEDDPFTEIPAQAEQTQDSAPEASSAEQPPVEQTSQMSDAEGAEQAVAEEPAPATSEQASTPPDAAEPAGFLGGKYKTTEDLEAAARNYIARNSQFFEENRQLKNELSEYKRAMEQAAPILRQHFQQPQQPPQGQQQVPTLDQIQDETDPERQRQLFNQAMNAAAEQAAQRQVQQHIAPLQQQQQEQMQQQQAAAVEAEVEAFYAAHQEDLERGSDVDQEMGDYILQLRRENSEAEDPIDAEMDYWAFPLTRDNLEAVHEAVRNPRVRAFIDDMGLNPTPQYIEIGKEVVENPRLERILRAMPELMDRPEGMELAREQASSPTLQQAQATQEVQQAQQAEALRRAAYSETGGTGAPVQAAPGQTPERDLFDEAIDLDRRERQGSVFFG